jgi:hypothetical protein
VTDALNSLAEVLAGVHARANERPTLDLLIGQIIAWDSTSQFNQVFVSGSYMQNIPILTSANTTGLTEGSSVAILRWRTQYFILGRIVTQDSGLVNPQFPIVLYPQFIPSSAVATTGYWTVPIGTLVTWEGRFKASFPYVEVDGIWGNAGGTGSVSYALKVAGTTIGTWSHTTLSVARHGPFDITPYAGQDWLKIEVAITASTGAGGEKAFSILGCYFRDS